MHPDELKQVIRQRRESLQVTQETLAQLAGVGLRTLKEIESGTGNPTIATLNRIADVLGMEIVLQVRKPDNRK
ncbi:MAG: helix-turn-helix transcriptional regulator [Bacteroidetes bacterium]|nr:helix-turn-helix transcriptional regulator [Bacteroidota bacterium]